MMHFVCEQILAYIFLIIVGGSSQYSRFHEQSVSSFCTNHLVRMYDVYNKYVNDLLFGCQQLKLGAETKFQGRILFVWRVGSCSIEGRNLLQGGSNLFYGGSNTLLLSINDEFLKEQKNHPQIQLTRTMRLKKKRTSQTRTNKKRTKKKTTKKKTTQKKTTQKKTTQKKRTQKKRTQKERTQKKRTQKERTQMMRRINQKKEKTRNSEKIDLI